MRFTYSVITESVMSLALRSISLAYCLPIAISFSWEMMLRCATLRLPIWSGSLLVSPARTGKPESASRTNTANVFRGMILASEVMESLHLQQYYDVETAEGVIPARFMKAV